jgi:hypothetical protein
MRQTATKHGHASSGAYRSWLAMKSRCSNPRVTQYEDYGGRGITVCDRWNESFDAFLEDMGDKPTPRHQIDRIDVEGNYEPSNCRWVTSQTNNNNKRSNRLLTFDGRTQSVAEWGRELGIRGATIGIRINDLGWSVERALTTPAVKRERNTRGLKYEHDGKSLTAVDWARELGVSKNTLLSRLERGWSIERALTQPLRPPRM